MVSEPIAVSGEQARRTRVRLLRAVKEHWRDPLYRNSYFLMGNTLAMSGLGFVFWLVVARTFDPVDVGLGSAVISAMTLLAMVSKLGLDIALVRHLDEMESALDALHFARTIFTVAGVAAVGVAVIFLVGLPLWSPELSFLTANWIFAVSFVGLVFVWNQASFLDSFLVAKRAAGFVLAKNTLYSLLKIPIPAILLATLGLRAYGIFASWGIAMFLSLGVMLLFVMRHVHQGFHLFPAIKRDMLSAMRRYASGNYVSGLALASVPMIFPLLVVNLRGSSDNAVFYIAWQFAGLLYMVPTAIGQPLLAEAARAGGLMGATLIRSVRHALMLVVPGLLILIVAERRLLSLFGDHYATQGHSLLLLLAVTALPLSVTNLYLSSLRANKNLRELIILSSLLAGGALGFGAVGLERFGLLGFGIGWLVVQSAAALYALTRIRSLDRRGTR